MSHLSGSQYVKIEGRCRDLSEAGIGILLPTELASGEVAGVSFCLPGSSVAWDLRAVVRHRRGYHYGFEFLALADEQRTELKNYFKVLETID